MAVSYTHLVIILSVFRLKLTLLTAHLHLFLLIRRKSFGKMCIRDSSDADPDEDLLVLLTELLDLVGRLLTELIAGILCGSPGSLRPGISSGGIILLAALLLVVLVHVLLLSLIHILHSLMLVLQTGQSVLT